MRWLLLRGGAAFSAWAAYARERVWRRGARAAADARWSRGLAARALLGWRHAVWHQQLMREARRSLDELSTPLLDAAPVMGARDMALGLWSAAIR